MSYPDEHDPLCILSSAEPYEAYVAGWTCECEPITRARADERQKAAEDIARAIEVCPHSDRCSYRAGHACDCAIGRDAAIARRVGGAS